MYSLLFMSTALCLLSNSWLMIWVLLEMNTLSFCSITKSSNKMELQMDSEMMMKYLIIQSIASIVLVISTTSSKLSLLLTKSFSILALLSLALKTGAAPLHQWFINISKQFKWAINMILFTWQKLAPTYLILFQAKKITMLFILVSSVLGSTLMMNKKNMKEIMAYSSVFNLSWMITAVMISTSLFLMFTFMYWVSVLFLLMMFKSKNISSMTEILKSPNKWIPMFVIGSLAGIPPLLGFLAKWMVFSISLEFMMKGLVSMLLISSTINLYIYMRMINSSITPNTSYTQKSKEKKTKMFMMVFLVLNTLSMLVVL